VAKAKATKLVEQDKVDVILGGIYSSTRQAIKGPAVVKGKKLYIYPEQYEGQECHPLIFCTGPIRGEPAEAFAPSPRRRPVRLPRLLPDRDRSIQRRAAPQIQQALFRGADAHGRQASTGTYRGLKFWEAAVKEAGSLNQDAVIKALDHAKIAAGPGGPAEMVPGQHHARLNMYIAQASNGIFEVVKNLGVIEPDESVVSAKLAASR
jgi:ABC-type branched-subunit amino acid transport system substrate-binding protein